jgi:putative PIN family toxin of toxin-antitoxin system
MKKVVVDTNVLVSATLTPHGNAAQIMNLISFEEIQFFYCKEILSEYERVLAYERLNIPISVQKDVLEGIKRLGISIVPVSSTFPMIDESDRIFYDTAKASSAILITNNEKHFPNEPFIMRQAKFYEEWIRTR